MLEIYETPESGSEFLFVCVHTLLIIIWGFEKIGVLSPNLFYLYIYYIYFKI